MSTQKRAFLRVHAGFYPIGDDQDLKDIYGVSRTWEDDEKWYSQSHMHLDMTEYCFILEGGRQIVVGDETYGVRPGDLIVTPPLKPHSMAGNLKLLCFTANSIKTGLIHGDQCPMICADAP
jgi:mannose-6-phosphate isomerase-like protein (cupin superfamily)